jgi:hypothetical protein
MINEIAMYRDGGSRLIEYNGLKYVHDWGFGSATRGQIFTYTNNPELRKPVDVITDANIRQEYLEKYGKPLKDNSTLF